MNWEQRCIRLCAAVLICAVVLRLWAGGALVPVGQALGSAEAASFLVYLQTGRVVRSLPEPTVQAQPQETVPPAQQEPPIFRAEDAALVAVDYNCDRSPDLEQLLTEPLDWDLTGDGPRVLILHSHTTESFTQGGEDRYEESSAYRTLDAGHNMIVLGEIVAGILRENGIEVIHDTTLHDYPSYNGSYTHAAASTKAYLEQYPTIELILDLHRDAAAVGNGQMDTSATVNGRESAQLMLVIGTDDGGLYHPGWEENLALAVKLQALLEQTHPGLCRPLNLCAERFNGDTSPGALLVEVGAAGNTRDEAMLAAEALADGIIALVNGANLTEDSTN